MGKSRDLYLLPTPAKPCPYRVPFAQNVLQTPFRNQDGGWGTGLQCQAHSLPARSSQVVSNKGWSHSVLPLPRIHQRAGIKSELQPTRPAASGPLLCHIAASLASLSLPNMLPPLDLCTSCSLHQNFSLCPLLQACVPCRLLC